MFYLQYRPIAMILSVTLFALVQLSRASQLGDEPEYFSRRQVRRTTQSSGLHDLSARLATGEPKKIPPWWQRPNTDNGEMNALTGQQLYPSGDENGDYSNDKEGSSTGGSVCRIKQCQSSGVLSKYHCGQHARCLRDYCQCDFGWKPVNDTPTARGWSGLEALTVWVDAQNLGCTERCNSLSCVEVPQITGCFDSQVTHESKNYDGSTQDPSTEGLATDFLDLGAIKAPSADVDIGD
ncbi:hypothetical protein C7974DRAFT_56132 [Boeremia exigua]|uniref:uncharacterized protein n=1 Tax=Boeremia exigua TaxID=749465 RepID=UPI001E8E8947|nr:uncharacterized protein C7974DRAFT_56132 [Boeremia exigua]KAH6614923.1 hypothetical protein C7974DRAFT_56132 [Boeremia exigua]